jgi:hypothetical protein
MISLRALCVSLLLGSALIHGCAESRPPKGPLPGESTVAPAAPDLPAQDHGSFADAGLEDNETPRDAGRKR